MAYPCLDCSIDTVPLGGGREYYEVWDVLWHRAGGSGTGQSDNGPGGLFLCIGCLEKRLGRRLVPGDFKPSPANTPSAWLSDRLNDRLGRRPVGPWASRDTAPQWHPRGLYAVADYVTAAGQCTYPKQVGG
jgi:hypothetical protein